MLSPVLRNPPSCRRAINVPCFASVTIRSATRRSALARATVVLILSYMMRSVAIFLNMAILLSYGRFNLFFFCLCLIPLVCSHATSPNFVPAIGMGEVHRVGTAIKPLGAIEFTAPNVDKRLMGDEKEEKYL
mmetsp:Transcript_16380/g.54844  ORF Transcript_16380/g.54844 Transcript_16380/m.54844 type:complete len:132 (+) Transcript_16380:441-836(+)